MEKNFKPAIQKIQKQIFPDYRISETSKRSLNTWLNHLLRRILHSQQVLLPISKFKTLNTTVLTTWIQLFFDAPLQNHLLEEIEEVIYHFDTMKSSAKKMSRSQRAGLVLSPAMIESVIRAVAHDTRIAESYVIALSATLEYLLAQMITLGGMDSPTSTLRWQDTPEATAKILERDADLKRALCRFSF